jgi:serine/threonine-protein kinase
MVQNCPDCGSPDHHAGDCAVSTGPTLSAAAADPRTQPSIGPAIGESFAGRYKILSYLGKGGSGTVFTAFDEILEDKIAIKWLPPEHCQNKRRVDYFKGEIVTARKIMHPGVVRIHDIGKADGSLYISMELLTGGTLKDWLASKGNQPPIGTCLSVAITLCRGLAAVHAQNIVHRDIKPTNVMFDSEGNAKLVDFGLARLCDVSHTTAVAGTPTYMSPEQFRGREITPASDIYSFGVMLFRMLTGTVPFKGTDWVSLARQHTTAPVPPLVSLRPDVPAGLEATIKAAMTKNPARRPASANELADRLEEHLREVRTASTPLLGRSSAFAATQLALAGAGIWILMTPAPGVSSQSLATAQTQPTATATAIETGRTVPTEDPLERVAPTPKATRVKATGKGTRRGKRQKATNRVATATPVATPSSQSRPGLLSVFTLGAWAEVWIDESRVTRETPLKSHHISAGKHRLRVVHPESGKVYVDREIAVDPDVALDVTVTTSTGAVDLKRRSMP